MLRTFDHGFTAGAEPVQAQAEAPGRAAAARAVAITANRRAATAPAGIYFTATATGFDVDDPYADLRYKWSFDDAGNLYTRFDTDDLPWDGVEDESGAFLGYSSDVAYGPHCSHVWFPAPEEFAAERARTGSTGLRKTVTVEVLSRAMVEAGEPPVTATFDVFVEDPDAVFPPTTTFYISPSGDFAGAPATAPKVRSFEEAVAATKRQTSRVRFLFNRGEMHDTTRRTSWDHSENYTHMHAGAYGTGAPPVLTGDGDSFGLRASSGAGEFAAWGFDMVGPYDPTDPENMTAKQTRQGFALNRALFYTVWDCKFAGWNTPMTGPPTLKNAVVGNVFITSWYEYGFYANTGISHVGFCGVAIKQALRTVGGEGKRDPAQGPRHPNHGPWRCSQNDGPVSFNLCDFRSLNSWSGRIQPCVRLGGNGNSDYPLAAKNSFDRCRAENGQMIGSGTYGGRTAYPKQAVYDKIYQVLLHDGGGEVMGFGCGGMTVRNVISVLVDQPRLVGGYGVFVKRRDEEVAHPSNADHPVEVYCNTFVDLRSPENDSSKGEGGLLPVDRESFELPPVPIPFAFDNNLLYVPNRGVGTWNAPEGYVPPEPLDRTVLWQVTFDGMRYGESPFDPLYATPPGTAATYAPLPGSPAVGAATEGLVAVDDFFGRVRGPKPSRGAVEPL